MRTDLDHLPETKRRELARAVEVLFAEFETAIAGRTMPYKRNGQILKVILFGSYARGDWVDDPASGYISDYDLLVVVNDEKLTDVTDYWTTADERLLRDYSISHRLTAPVNFIVHCRPTSARRSPAICNTGVPDRTVGACSCSPSRRAPGSRMRLASRPSPVRRSGAPASLTVARISSGTAWRPAFCDRALR
jgi:hypothetical protein